MDQPDVKKIGLIHSSPEITRWVPKTTMSDTFFFSGCTFFFWVPGFKQAVLPAPWDDSKAIWIKES